MKRKLLPILSMLCVGLVSLIITTALHYELVWRLFYLFVGMLIIYCLSSTVLWFVNRFELENDRALAQAGEVIEKEGAEEPQSDADAKQS